VVFVTLEDCHLLDGLVVVFIEACKEDCAVLRREVIMRGVVLASQEPRRATLDERVIELPSLGPWGSCGAQRVGLVWC
jgi:hypothetical protein